MSQQHAKPRFCPECGARALLPRCQKSLVCSQCGFCYFHNVAAAVAGLIVHQQQLLLVKRALEPAKGLLDLPGGFVDPNESNEQALQRELREELGLQVSSMRYLFSFPNTYLYRQVSYSTVDNFFLIELHELPELQREATELSELLWCKLEDIDPAHIAFDSIRRALARVVEQNLLV